MKMSFRWYGEADPVRLDHICQIPGLHGIASAVYDVPPGGIWPLERILALKASIEAQGLAFEVVESVPVHEDIKLGRPTRNDLIAAYQQSLRNLGAAGVKVVCYNFMPVFDWTRTILDQRMADGSTTLAFQTKDVDRIDASKGIALPGWDASYQPEELKGLLAAYDEVGEEGLRRNLAHFLEAVIPVAEAAGLRMAIHPDDPPRPIFGLPRIVKDREDVRRLLKVVDSPANGLTLCSGSFGAGPQNDVLTLAREFGAQGRIPFAHLRNVRVTPEGDFEETAHPSACGSLDMAAIVKALHDTGFDGYIRPDHGRMIWGETGRPGYGLYDRALGVVYLNGLWEAIAKYA